MGRLTGLWAAAALVALGVTAVVLSWAGREGSEHRGDDLGSAGTGATASGHGATNAAPVPPEEDGEVADSPLQPVRREFASSLHLTVVDSDGEAVGHAEVVGFAADLDDVPTGESWDPRDLIDGLAKLRREVPEDGLELDLQGLVPGLLMIRADGYSSSARWIGLDGEAVPTALQIVLGEALGLSGTVVDDRTGQPLARAELSCMPSRHAVDRDGQGWWRLDQALSGDRAESAADGSFELQGLRDIAHELRCSKPGYATARLLLARPGDEVELRLCGGGEIHGFVEDEDGEPVEGAQVIAQAQGRRPATSVTGTTDENGEYLLDPLPAGPFLVHVYSTSHAYQSRNLPASARSESIDFVLPPMLPFRGRVVDDRGVPIANAQLGFEKMGDPIGNVGASETEEDGSWWMFCIGEGQIINIDATAEGHYAIAYAHGVRAPQEDLVLIIPRDATLAGAVLGLGGEAVSEFHVQVIPLLESEKLDRPFREAELWKTFADGSGEFEIPGLWPTRSELRIQAAGHEPHFQRIELPPGETRRLEIRLEAAVALQGSVVDSAGDPVEGASVRIAAEDDQGRAWLGGSRVVARSDAGGQFQLEQSVEGAFDLVLSHPDFGMRLLRDQRRADYPRRLVLEQPGAVAGRVTLPWPNAASRVRIVVSGTSLFEELMLEEDRSFRSGAVQPGAYEVQLVDEWFDIAHGNARPLTRSVRVASGRTTLVELDACRRGSVRGLLHVEDGAMSPDDHELRLRAVVEGEQEGGQGARAGDIVARSHPNDDGVFHFPSVDTGAYILQVVGRRSGSVLDLQRELEVDGEEHVELRVPAPRLLGRVQVDGAPAEAARVIVFGRGSPGQSASARTDGEGCYRLFTTEEDGWIGVSAPGRADQLVSLPDSSGSEELLHDLELEARLHVVVVDAQGQVIPEATVRVDRPGFPPPHRTLSRAAGSLAEFTRLPAGRSTIEVHAAGHVPVTRAITLSAGQLSETRIELVAYASLSVQVVDLEGRPVRGHEVLVEVEEHEPQTVRTDDRGAAWLARVVPGELKVRCGDVVATVMVEAGAREGIELVVGG